jgi:predicted RNase H-like HicB family nuclease
MKTFGVFVEYDPVTKLYVGIVPGLPGAHTQGATLDELYVNVKEVVALCWEETGTVLTS